MWYGNSDDALSLAFVICIGLAEQSIWNQVHHWPDHDSKVIVVLTSFAECEACVTASCRCLSMTLNCSDENTVPSSMALILYNTQLCYMYLATAQHSFYCCANIWNFESNSYFSIRFKTSNYSKFSNTYHHQCLIYLTEWCRRSRSCISLKSLYWPTKYWNSYNRNHNSAVP